MELDPDLSEFIGCCVAREVRFLVVVGGYAVAAHGHPRYTKDLDVWVWIDPPNARRLIEALGDFGFGSLGLVEADFAEPGVVVGSRSTSAACGCRSSTWPTSWSTSAPQGRLQDLADAEALSGDVVRESDLS